MNDYFVSLIRTYVPVGVGSVLAWLAVQFGIVVDEDTSTALKLGAAAVIVAGYYTLARAVEQRWPGLGRFLVAFGLTGRRAVTYPQAQR